jgi:ATP-dependent RNA helicase DeaD
VVDHLQRGTLTLDDIGIFVLDEADEMLSMGFADEVDRIVAALPKERQSVLFTATLASAIEKLAKKTLKNPVTVRMGAGAAPDIQQFYATVAGRERADAIARIMEAEEPRAALLFARTRARVDDLAQQLSGIGSEALHGGMGQPMRDAVMRRFRSGRTKLLIATDVAARGLDVDEIDIVLHDEPAGDTDTYIHRIGRTGRAGRKGRSILFLGPGKTKRLGNLSRVAGRLDEYKIPDAGAIGRIRNTRLLTNLQEKEPTEEAQALLKRAVEGGMDVQDIALFALQHLLDERGEVTEATPVVQGANGALALKVGKMDNVHAGSIVGVLTNVGGLNASDIGRIDVLDKMSVVEVPSAQMERLCQDLDGVRLTGRELKPRPADDWRFKAAPRR